MDFFIIIIVPFVVKRQDQKASLTILFRIKEDHPSTYSTDYEYSSDAVSHRKKNKRERVGLDRIQGTISACAWRNQKKPH